MNLPNKLTILRVIMIPFFVLFMLVPIIGPEDKWIALALFIVASLTDLLDGHIARKYNHPGRNPPQLHKANQSGADQQLIRQRVHKFAEIRHQVIVIIAREFIISGFRLIASDNGVVIAASYWGKFKTTFQMIMICLMIANLEPLHLFTDIVMWIALLLTVISLMDYLLKNKEVMKETK